MNGPQTKVSRRPEPPREPPAIEGKLPPHDLDAEAAVLSAVLLNEQAGIFSEVADILQSEAIWYSEAHRQVWIACTRLHAASQPINVVMVAGQLKDDQRLAQVGGPGYLSTILDAAPHVTVAHARAYAERIVELYRTRQTILLCQTTAGRGYHEPMAAARLLEDLETGTMRIGQAQTRDRTIEMRPLLRRCYDKIYKTASDNRPPGIATGLRAYDDLTVGLHTGELTIVGARPGMGKTALLLSIAINVAGSEPLLLSDDGTPWQPDGVGIFSLEMPDDQIGNRMIAIDSRVSAQRMRTGRLHEDDWSPLTHSCHMLADLPILVDDTSAITVSALRSKIRRMRMRMARREKPARLRVVIVDYLQLMEGEGESNRAEALARISRGLKLISKEEDVALLAGCQLNRALESRTGAEKRPRISDLRESGSLEQDADNVVFIYRPEVYGEDVPVGEEGKTELILGKQRNGPIGTAYVRYVAGCTRFEELPTH